MPLTPLEHTVVNAFRRRQPVLAVLPQEGAGRRLAAGLLLMLELGRMLRRARFQPHCAGLRRKPDGSVVTDWDLAAERFARGWLQRTLPGMAFVGEETGGELARNGRTAALDPIDGSWSFVSRDASFGVSLAFLDGRRVTHGLVLNPGTGELAYAAGDAGSRLIQLSGFGEGECAAGLPWPPPDDGDRRPLVNLQPAVGHRPLARRLKDAWDAELLRHVKNTGGSPALALLEAAKGRYVYVHPWSAAPAAPYDLAAGVLLLRSAGGQVVDASGHPVQPLGHRGLMAAGIDPGAVATVRRIVTGR